MNCASCKEKIDRSDLFKIMCTDCKCYFHCACVNILQSDFEDMKHFRCDKCIAKKVKVSNFDEKG